MQKRDISAEFSPSAFKRLQHAARMEQRRERYLNPPKRDIEQMVPHPSRFEKPADRKLWPDFHAKLALECGVSLEDAVRLTSMKHGFRVNRFNQWGRRGDEKQTTRRRLYRNSEEGIRKAKLADARYRTAVREQSAAGIARMAALAGRII